MGKLSTATKLSGMALFFGICAVLLVLTLPGGGWKAMSVQTGSMRPAIDPGALVLVHSVPVNSLQVGDAITYVNPKNNKQTITHRIVQKMGQANGPKTFIVKGDANPNPDLPVSQNSIVGKVSVSIPYLGRAVDFVRKPIGLLLLIYIPALAIIISEVRRLSGHYRKIRPYVSPQIMNRVRSSVGKARLMFSVKFGIFLLAIAVGIGLPTFAAFTTSATLTDNTITSAGVTPPAQCPLGGNTNNTNINISGSGTNNNNNVVVNNSNNQNASTGDATVSGNTTGGNATSGNATNTNCTNVNINITNNP